MVFVATRVGCCCCVLAIGSSTAGIVAVVVVVVVVAKSGWKKRGLDNEIYFKKKIRVSMSAITSRVVISN